MKTVFSIFLLWLMGFGCLPSLEAQENHVRIAVSEEKEPTPIKISAYDNKIVVENAPVGSKLEINRSALFIQPLPITKDWGTPARYDPVEESGKWMIILHDISLRPHIWDH